MGKAKQNLLGTLEVKFWLQLRCQDRTRYQSYLGVSESSRFFGGFLVKVSESIEEQW